MKEKFARHARSFWVLVQVAFGIYVVAVGLRYWSGYGDAANSSEVKTVVVVGVGILLVRAATQSRQIRTMREKISSMEASSPAPVE